MKDDKTENTKILRIAKYSDKKLENHDDHNHLFPLKDKNYLTEFLQEEKVV